MQLKYVLVRLVSALALCCLVQACSASGDTNPVSPSNERDESVSGDSDAADATDDGDAISNPDTTDDVEQDTGNDTGPIRCGLRAHPVDDVCVCDEGYVENDSGDCVECLTSDQCGSRVCSGFVCRNCLNNEECGEGWFCGEGGECTETAPECTRDGEERCENHRIQVCDGETWTEAPDECPFGCDDESGECYAEANAGWIGGACGTTDDCELIDEPTVACLPEDEGFVGGSCTQRCTSTCPDISGDDIQVTFCVDSEGLNDAGMCVSKCDFDIFPDEGCRAGFECREMSRYSQPGVVSSVCLPINWWRNPSRTFDYGIASGEVTPTSAIIWTRTGAAAELEVRYGTDPDVLGASEEGETTAGDGFHGQVELTGLRPATQYYYQVIQDGVAESAVGEFRTAPTEDAHVPVRFAFSGDVDDRGDHLFDIFNLLTEADVDFYLTLGDWPYADSATTEEAYHREHAATRHQLQARNFLASTSIYGIFDDHEVINDWDSSYRRDFPEQVDMGLRIWSLWFPLRRAFDNEFYRSFRWGDLEFFILDTRSHRDDKDDPDDLDKTMLGSTQFDWLVSGLRNSDAVFKLVVTTVPLDFSTNGSDAWVGYTTERDLLFETISAEDIGGVVFLAADQHWFSAHHHNSGFKEFQVGPISAFLREPNPTQSESILTTVKDYNFGLVEYNPTDRTLYFEAINDDGDVIYSELVESGRGRIDVETSSGAPMEFRICPDDRFVSCDGDEVPSDPCTHVFYGVAPATFDYAVPGPYLIDWLPAPGEDDPPDETLCLEADRVIRFEAETAAIELPWSDDFSSDKGWHILDEGRADGPSAWSVRSGRFHQSSNIYDNIAESNIRRLGTLAWHGSLAWEDYTISASFNNSDDDSVGLIARYQDANNYYRFSLDNQRGQVRLMARVDGEFVMLDEEDITDPYDIGSWTDISLTVDGSDIEGRIDDVLIVHATDVAHDKGAVGLYVWGCEGIDFDDVSVVAE